MQTYRVSELIPGPIVAHIGRICVQWSILELTIERAIWHLSGVGRKQGRLITAKENLDPRLERLKKLANQKLSGEELTEVRDIIKEVKRVGKLRNWVVHGLYGFDKNDVPHSLTYRDDPNGKALKMDDWSLRYIRNSTSDVRRRLERLVPPR